MNPALAPTRGYLSIPVAGELFVGTESNLKFTNFIYPAEVTGGELRTFLHPSINGADFMEALGGDQYLRTDHSDQYSFVMGDGLGNRVS